MQIISCKETSNSVNSLSISDQQDILVAGQSGGHITTFRIGTLNSFMFETLKDNKLSTKNINKVVRTTRADFALGTENGVIFCGYKPSDSHNLAIVSEALQGKDITELSEFQQDKFVIG
jgi:hypothetical protein